MLKSKGNQVVPLLLRQCKLRVKHAWVATNGWLEFHPLAKHLCYFAFMFLIT